MISTVGISTTSSGESVTPPAARFWPFVVVILIALAFLLQSGITTALLVCLFVLVVHRGSLCGGIPVVTLFAGSGLFIASGMTLYLLNSSPTPPRGTTAAFTVIFLSTQALSVPILIWAIRQIGLALTLIAYGIGLYGNFVLFLKIPPTDYKYAIALPAALIVGGVLAHRPRLLICALAALAVLGMSNGARSYAAFLAVSGLLWAASRLMVKRSATRPWLAYLGLSAGGAAIGLMAYALGQTLLVDGYLGQYNQIRTVTQLRQTGTLLTSARPEWFATFGLMRDNPWGPGMGAVPDTHAVMVGLSGLNTINFRGGTYVTQYMLGDVYELHSVIADMWANCGPVGLVGGIALFVYLFWHMLQELTSPQTNPLVIFVVLSSMWYLLFGPMLSNLPFVAFTLAVVIARRASASNPRATASVGATS